MSTYRYRVILDDDSNPVGEWANQSVWTDPMTDDERADWLDANQWTSHGVVQEVRCDCCGTWTETDAVWGFDRHESHYHDMADGGPLEVGEYELRDLPEYVRCHFTEDAPTERERTP